jgi:hypothetical protein
VLRHCYCGISRWSRVSFDGSGVVWLHACGGRPAANPVMLRRQTVGIKRIKETVEPPSLRVSRSIQFIREVLWAVCALGGSGVAGTFRHTVRTRGIYTGESSRWLMGHASVSRSTPIPDASESGQTRLEAAVFRARTSCGEYTPNPAGVVRTRIIADGTTVVHVDPPERRLPQRVRTDTTDSREAPTVCRS